MRVFRRSQMTSAVSEREEASVRQRVVTLERAGQLSLRDYGPVIVAVDGNPAGWSALEWATAEAAARQCTLRIVHSVSWPSSVPDISGGFVVNQWDPAIEDRGAQVLEEAADRARSVAPAIQVTTHLYLGGIAAAMLSEARHDALIVLGRGSGSDRSSSVNNSVSRQIVRRSGCPVAVVELFGKSSPGPSAGRVVVGVDARGDVTAALGFAFRAAQRRGVGLTAVLAWTPRRSIRRQVEVTEALRLCRAAYPTVDCRQQVTAVPPGPALAAESAGAALVVLATPARGRPRRRIFESAETLLRSALSPIAIIGSCSR
jgi:nucleotide-binding universal stress UspA family protein